MKWFWYQSIQKTMFYLMKSNYAIFSNIKVTKIERSAFLGRPVYFSSAEKASIYSFLIFFTIFFLHTLGYYFVEYGLGISFK